jgi:hypothetical protein
MIRKTVRGQDARTTRGFLIADIFTSQIETLYQLLTINYQLLTIHYPIGFCPDRTA